MKRDVQRKKDMIIQLDRTQLDYEFFEGADGKSMTDTMLNQIADRDKLVTSRKRPFEQLKGLIGCTYSHYLIYDKMVKESIDVCCVLEDDVILSEQITAQLEWVENNIKKNEVISLHTLLFEPVSFQSTDRKNEHAQIVIPNPPKIRGTQGYVITQYCAQQLMKEMMPIKEFPDCFNRYHLFCPDVQIRVLFPFIIRHMWIDSVRDDHMGVVHTVINFIQKNKIYPFWHLIRQRRRRINDKHIRSQISLDGHPINYMYQGKLNDNRLNSYL